MLVLALVLSLAACGGSKPAPAPTEAPKVEEAKPAEPEKPAEEPKAEEPAAEAPAAEAPAEEAPAAEAAADAPYKGVNLTINIWDANQAPGIQQIANDWAATSGATVKVEVVDWDNYWTLLEAGASGLHRQG